MTSHNVYYLTWISLTLDVGYLCLLQQSTATTPYLDEGYLLTAAPPDLECWVSPLSPPAPLLSAPQRLKHLPPMQETRAQSLGWENILEKEMVTHSSILAWLIPWIEKPCRLQSMGLQRVRDDWATSLILVSEEIFSHVITEAQDSYWSRWLECWLLVPHFLRDQHGFRCTKVRELYKKASD